ncbi:MAG: hypothetical protein OXR66_07645 [Candidatus Woesearchaeota archaeon]|nr:hypothetical protein [Candidatus Woesearchaeota archaeon]
MFVALEEVDKEKIQSMVRIAAGDISAAERLKKELDDESIEWNSVYKLYYDAIHELTEAFLRFDFVKSANHQCLFAYLCEKYAYEFRFFETMRKKRNGINYYGTAVQHTDWQHIEEQFYTYVRKLQKNIEERL